MKALKKSSIALLSLILVFVLATYYWLILRKTYSLSDPVAPATHKVLIGYYESRYIGGYWDDDLLQQWGKIKSMDLGLRLEFYSSIIRLIPMDAESAYVFSTDVVGQDTKYLVEHLDRMIAQKDFMELDEAQRSRIEDWANGMRQTIHLYESAPPR